MVALLYRLSVLFLLVPAVSLARDSDNVQLVQQAGAPAIGPTEGDMEQDFRRTRDILRASPEFRSDSAETHYLLGRALHHRGDMNGAMEEYRLAVQRDPRFGDAYRDLGALLLDRHDYADAVAALEQALQLGRQDGETYYWLGRGLMGKGDWASAAAALLTTTWKKPDDAEAYADLGLVRMVQGDVEGATGALRISIQLKPDYAEAHTLMEILTAHQADHDQLKRAAQRILATLFAR